jgi:beta-phosphoglucomutase-like phosphatase (HAD superfamily)
MPHDRLAVIFDLDGLLVDTEPMWNRSADIVLGRRGFEYDDDLRQRGMGRHPLEVARMMVEHYDLKDEPTALMRERLDEQRALYRSGISLLPGARPLAEALAQASIPMAVASGSPTELVNICLQAAGSPRDRAAGSARTFRDHFGAVFGSDLVARGKPAPDLFLLAAKKMGIAPTSCLVLEDAPSGVVAAKAAKMSVVQVVRADAHVEGHSDADLVCQSLEQLSVPLLQTLAQRALARSER